MSSKDALDIDHSVLLSDATLSALQIDQQPFGPLEADSVLYLDETTSEQLADVKQALITGDDLLLILGASGAGKTVLLKQLGENSGLRIQCFAVKGSARFSTLNLFAGMLEAFKRPPPEKLKDILDELIPCLQTMVTRNTLSAIVLDDAHRVTETELTQLLSGMLYLNSQDETLLRVALAAPAEFEDHIPDLLPEGADLPYSSLTIDGMNPSRAADYLSYRLAQAGFDGEWPFSDRDVDNLVAQSGGLPGTLHAITATSLNQRYGPTDDLLTEDLITEPSGSLMDSRIGKLALGVLAAILIVGGLSMFIPERSGDNADRYSSEEAKPLGGEESSQTLKLVEETPVVEPKPFVVAEAQPVDEPQASEGSDPDGTADDTESSISTLADESPDALPAPADTITPSGSAASATASSPDAPVNEDPDVQSPADSIVIVADENPPEPAESDTASAGESELNSLSPSESAATVPTDTDTPTQTAAAADVPASELEEGLVDEAAADVDPDLVGVLESPTWILVQDQDLFTVQMSASRDRESVENFLKRNASVLPTPNSIYTFIRDGDTWFALLNGLYPSIDDARSAVEGMPSSALTNQPWIRSVGRVQDVLKAQ